MGCWRRKWKPFIVRRCSHITLSASVISLRFFLAKSFNREYLSECDVFIQSLAINVSLIVFIPLPPLLSERGRG